MITIYRLKKNQPQKQQSDTGLWYIFAVQLSLDLGY